MYFRRKKTINFKEPDYVEDPLFTFTHDKILIVTDQGTLVVEEKPKRKVRRFSDEEEGNED